MDIQKIRDFVHKEYQINPDCLSDTAVIKLAQFILIVWAIETPMIAKHYKLDLGL